MFPTIPISERLERLKLPKGPVSVVIDTDPYNEIDDQFAIVYALLSPERINVQAIYAAPFANPRSNNDAGRGMEMSFETAQKVVDKLGIPTPPPIYKGSNRFMTKRAADLAGMVPGGATNDLVTALASGFVGEAVQSEAASNLVERAMKQPDGEPLYVTALAAITNVASAIILEPAIINKIVVVWLAGHPHNFYHTNEFNLGQDVYASRILLDCGVPLVMLPCYNVAEHLLLTNEDVENRIRGRGDIGDYLADEFVIYSKAVKSLSRPIWDIAPFAWLVNPSRRSGTSAVETALIPSPLLSVSPLRTDDYYTPLLTQRPVLDKHQSAHCTWANDPRRHPIVEALRLNRDSIFDDFYNKLDAHTAYQKK